MKKLIKILNTLPKKDAREYIDNLIQKIQIKKKNEAFFNAVKGRKIVNSQDSSKSWMIPTDFYGGVIYGNNSQGNLTAGVISDGFKTDVFGGYWMYVETDEYVKKLKEEYNYNE